MLKIAISGRAGSGKNTVATVIARDILQLKLEEYRIAAFADKIKELATVFFPNCNQEALYGASELRQNKIESEINKIINTDVTYREATLDIGKLGRSYGPSFWVAHAALRYMCASPNTLAYMLADLRFVEEYNWVKDNGFTLIRVKRNDLIQINDISETDQNKLLDDMFDIVIENNGSIDELRETLTIELDRLFSNNLTYLQVRDAAR